MGGQAGQWRRDGILADVHASGLRLSLGWRRAVVQMSLSRQRVRHLGPRRGRARAEAARCLALEGGQRPSARRVQGVQVRSSEANRTVDGTRESRSIYGAING